MRARRFVLAALLAVMASSVGTAPVAIAGAPAEDEGIRIAQEPEVALPQRDLEAELQGLRLLNCTRTGGWVRVDGTCKGRATGTYSPYLRPLRLHDGISSLVAFGWASELVKAKVCDHVIPGLPDLQVRLASAGFLDASFGENLGCWWSDMPPRDVVIAVHRLMQAEKAYDGGHWRNMKNPGYRTVGIGVATAAGRTTVVFDFYGG
ncbi:MAG TPA: CAP domain-containing protein [Candidatus Deferrimicrobium sp.]|nr:CAP domain-containing protein [Candidatus Deferrimicrobium sp.]